MVCVESHIRSGTQSIRFYYERPYGGIPSDVLCTEDNFLFVYATPEKVEKYVKQTPELHYLTYYYNHFKVGEFGKNPPLTVGYNEMMNFIRVTSLNNEHVRLVESQHCHYKSGDKVRIVDGDFAGVEGKVARVAGLQRVVIELPGVCLVATAYIPTAFIKPIPSVSEK